MKVSGNQVFRDGVASISAPLQSALDVIERWARDAYVVCGKPCTQEGFEAAWKAEDADAYSVWVAGRASLAANAVSEPVAVVGSNFALYWAGSGPIAPIVEKHGIKVGSPLYAHPSPPERMAGWISVDERLPEWAARDDTPCFINGKSVPPTLTSETVLVALKGGGVRTDKLTTIEGKSAGWWHTYGERVIAWQKLPPPPLASEAKDLT